MGTAKSEDLLKTKKSRSLADIYPVYIQAAARQRAQDLNIQLHFGPVVPTDQYQPLDQRALVSLKGFTRGAFMKRSVAACRLRIDKR
jgi:hypothetical protein